MNSIWKGMFAPIVKHVLSTKFVPVEEMTNEDWDVLDYSQLRPSARVRIDEAILDGTLDGFLRVDYDLHKAHTPHGGKPRYFFPVIKGVQNPSKEELGAIQNFESGVDQDSVSTEPSDRMDDILQALRLYLTAQMMVEILKRIKQDEDPGHPEEYYEEFANSAELLQERHRLLLLTIKLMATDPKRAKKILDAIDNLDDEVYAALNDEEPTE